MCRLIGWPTFIADMTGSEVETWSGMPPVRQSHQASKRPWLVMPVREVDLPDLPTLDVDLQDEPSLSRTATVTRVRVTHSEFPILAALVGARKLVLFVSEHLGRK